MYGTSAGTNLGPLLFIIVMHDIPRSIFPKFADDLVCIAVGRDVTLINQELQQAVDKLVQWSQKWRMVLSVSKTYVMLFGDSNAGAIDLMMNGRKIEQVSQQKYLGVLLDSELNFLCRWTLLLAKQRDLQPRFVACLTAKRESLCS